MFDGKINLRGKVMQAGYLRFLDFEITSHVDFRDIFPLNPDYSLIAISSIIKHWLPATNQIIGRNQTLQALQRTRT